MYDDIIVAVDTIKRGAGNGFVVITFVNESYIHLFENWLLFAKNVNIDNIFVMALDRRIEDACIKHGVAYAVIDAVNSLEELWLKRVLLFRLLSNSGIDFIHSDVDAIWLKSPVDRIDPIEVDLVFSQGTVHPPDAANKWGFVLCCGFFAARGRPSVVKFFDAVARQIKTDLSDQAAINHVLMQQGIKWTKTDPDHRHTLNNGRVFYTYKDDILGVCNDINVCMLPHHQFTRLKELSDDTYVLHPISKKYEIQKIQLLKKLGAWSIIK